MLTDPIADMLTRIRNANLALHDTVEMPGSSLKADIARVLEEQGYIAGFETSADGSRSTLLVKLKYDEDRRRVLERANAIRLIETLRFVAPYLDDPNLAEPACLSVVELAHHRSLRDANKEEFTKALDKVLGTTKNEELVDRATRYKQGQTWERKKPAGS